MSGIVIDVDSGAPKATREVENLSKALEKSLRTSARASANFNAFDGGSVKRMQEQILGLQKQVLNLDKRTQSLTANTERGFNRAGAAAGGFADKVKYLVTALLALKGASVLQKTGDEFAQIANRISLISDGTTDTVVKQRDMYRLAKMTRSELGTSADMMVTMTRAAESSNVSYSRIARAVATINRAGAMSGQPIETTRAAIQQLNQGIAANRFSGQEFNSVAEGMGYLMKPLAQQFKMTAGELRKFSEEGGLSADTLLDAFEKMHDAVEKDFAKTGMTVGQSINRMRTAVKFFVGDLLDFTQSSRGVSTRLGAIATAFDSATENVTLSIATARAQLVSFVRDADKMAPIEWGIKAYFRGDKSLDLAIATYRKVKRAQEVLAAYRDKDQFMNPELDQKALEEQLATLRRAGKDVPELNYKGGGFTRQQKELLAAAAAAHQLTLAKQEVSRAVRVAINNFSRLGFVIRGPVRDAMQITRDSFVEFGTVIAAKSIGKIAPSLRSLQGQLESLSGHLYSDTRIARGWVSVFRSKNIVEFKDNLRELNDVRARGARSDKWGARITDMTLQMKAAGKAAQDLGVSLGVADQPLISVRTKGAMVQIAHHLETYRQVFRMLYTDILFPTLGPAAVKFYNFVSQWYAAIAKSAAATFNFRQGADLGAMLSAGIIYALGKVKLLATAVLSGSVDEQSLAGKLLSTLTSAILHVGDALRGVVTGMWRGIFSAVDLSEAGGRAVGKGLGDMLRRIDETLAGKRIDVKPLLSEIAGNIAEGLSIAGRWLRGVASGFFGSIGEAMTVMKGFDVGFVVGKLLRRIKDSLSAGTGTAIGSSFKGAFVGAGDQLKAAIAKLLPVARAALRGVWHGLKGGRPYRLNIRQFFELDTSPKGLFGDLHRGIMSAAKWVEDAYASVVFPRFYNKRKGEFTRDVRAALQDIFSEDTGYRVGYAVGAVINRAVRTLSEGLRTLFGARTSADLELALNTAFINALKRLGLFIRGFVRGFWSGLTEGIRSEDIVAGAALAFKAAFAPLRTIAAGLLSSIDVTSSLERWVAKGRGVIATLFDELSLTEYTASVQAGLELFLRMIARIIVVAQKGLDAAAAVVAAFGERIKDIFFSVYDTVVGHSTWPDLIDGVINHASRLKVAEKKVKAFADSIKGLFADAYKSLASNNYAGPLLKKLSTAFASFDMEEFKDRMSRNFGLAIISGMMLVFGDARLKGAALHFFASSLFAGGGIKTEFAAWFGGFAGSTVSAMGTHVAKALKDLLAALSAAAVPFVKGFLEEFIGPLTMKLVALAHPFQTLMDFFFNSTSAIGAMSAAFLAYILLVRGGMNQIGSLIFGKPGKKNGKGQVMDAGEAGLLEMVTGFRFKRTDPNEDPNKAFFKHSGALKLAALAMATSLLDSVSLLAASSVAVPLLYAAIVGPDGIAKLRADVAAAAKGVLSTVSDKFKAKQGIFGPPAPPSKSTAKQLMDNIMANRQKYVYSGYSFGDMLFKDASGSDIELRKRLVDMRKAAVDGVKDIAVGIRDSVLRIIPAARSGAMALVGAVNSALTHLAGNDTLKSIAAGFGTILSSTVAMIARYKKILIGAGLAMATVFATAATNPLTSVTEDIGEVTLSLGRWAAAAVLVGAAMPALWTALDLRKNLSLDKLQTVAVFLLGLKETLYGLVAATWNLKDTIPQKFAAAWGLVSEKVMGVWRVLKLMTKEAPMMPSLTTLPHLIAFYMGQVASLISSKGRDIQAAFQLLFAPVAGAIWLTLGPVFDTIMLSVWALERPITTVFNKLRKTPAAVTDLPAKLNLVERATAAWGMAVSGVTKLFNVLNAVGDGVAKTMRSIGSVLLSAMGVSPKMALVIGTAAAAGGIFGLYYFGPKGMGFEDRIGWAWDKVKELMGLSDGLATTTGGRIAAIAALTAPQRFGDKDTTLREAAGNVDYSKLTKTQYKMYLAQTQELARGLEELQKTQFTTGEFTKADQSKLDDLVKAWERAVSRLPGRTDQTQAGLTDIGLAEINYLNQSTAARFRQQFYGGIRPGTAAMSDDLVARVLDRAGDWGAGKTKAAIAQYNPFSESDVTRMRDGVRLLKDAGGFLLKIVDGISFLVNAVFKGLYDNIMGVLDALGSGSVWQTLAVVAGTAVVGAVIMTMAPAVGLLAGIAAAVLTIGAALQAWTIFKELAKWLDQKLLPARTPNKYQQQLADEYAGVNKKYAPVESYLAPDIRKAIRQVDREYTQSIMAFERQRQHTRSEAGFKPTDPAFDKLLEQRLAKIEETRKAFLDIKKWGTDYGTINKAVTEYNTLLTETNMETQKFLKLDLGDKGSLFRGDVADLEKINDLLAAAKKRAWGYQGPKTGNKAIDKVLEDTLSTAWLRTADATTRRNRLRIKEADESNAKYFQSQFDAITIGATIEFNAKNIGVDTASLTKAIQYNPALVAALRGASDEVQKILDAQARLDPKKPDQLAMFASLQTSLDMAVARNKIRFRVPVTPSLEGINERMQSLGLGELSREMFLALPDLAPQLDALDASMAKLDVLSAAKDWDAYRSALAAVNKELKNAADSVHVQKLLDLISQSERADIAAALQRSGSQATAGVWQKGALEQYQMLIAQRESLTNTRDATPSSDNLLEISRAAQELERVNARIAKLSEFRFPSLDALTGQLSDGMSGEMFKALKPDHQRELVSLLDRLDLNRGLQSGLEPSQAGSALHGQLINDERTLQRSINSFIRATSVFDGRSFKDLMGDAQTITAGDVQTMQGLAKKAALAGEALERVYNSANPESVAAYVKAFQASADAAAAQARLQRKLSRNLSTDASSVNSVYGTSLSELSVHTLGPAVSDTAVALDEALREAIRTKSGITDALLAIDKAKVKGFYLSLFEDIGNAFRDVLREGARAGFDRVKDSLDGLRMRDYTDLPTDTRRRLSGEAALLSKLEEAFNLSGMTEEMAAALSSAESPAEALKAFMAAGGGSLLPEASLDRNTSAIEALTAAITGATKPVTAAAITFGSAQPDAEAFRRLEGWKAGASTQLRDTVLSNNAQFANLRLAAPDLTAEGLRAASASQRARIMDLYNIRTTPSLMGPPQIGSAEEADFTRIGEADAALRALVSALNTLGTAAYNAGIGVKEAARSGFSNALNGLFSGDASKGGIFGTFFFNFADTLSKGVIDAMSKGLTEAVFGGPLDELFSDFGKAIFDGLSGALSGEAGGGLGGLLKSGFSAIMSWLPFASGGYVSGPGTSTSDSIPARLSNGEFVVKAAATRKHLPLLQAINSGRALAAFAEGGLVQANNLQGLSSAAIPHSVQNNSNSQEININITGDISRQTKSEIYKMLPQIAAGVNSHNKEQNYIG